MKIWVVGRSYPTPSNNMRGSFEVEQAKMLAKNGHDVVYLALVFHYKNKVKNWGSAEWTDENIRIYTYSQLFFPDRFHIYMDSFQERKWTQFLKSVEGKEGQPDIIHIHYPAMISSFNVMKTYQDHGTGIVVTDHWSRTLLGKLNQHELKQITNYANNADCFICVGVPLRDAVNKQTKTENKIEVVPNVVSDIFKPMKTENKIFQFVATGRLAAHRQFDKIIEAFAISFKGNADVQLTIVGNGPEYKNLVWLVEQVNVKDQVHFTGVLPRDKVAEIVAKSDALVCYSRLDTFGVPVIEAWACGKPVIASDCLGFLEYWNDGLGEIVPHDKIDELAEAMKRMFDDKKNYDAEMIAGFAQENFSEKAIYRKIEMIYLLILENANDYSSEAAVARDI